MVHAYTTVLSCSRNDPHPPMYGDNEDCPFPPWTSLYAVKPLLPWTSNLNLPSPTWTSDFASFYVIIYQLGTWDHYAVMQNP